MPRPEDSGGSPHSRLYRMLLCCLRRALKPSASAIAISKLYQLFRVRDHPYGLQNSLPTLNSFCSLHLFRSVSGVRPPRFPPLPLMGRSVFPININIDVLHLLSPIQLRYEPKARYGWVANPYRISLLISFPTGTFTLKDTPSFPRRDNANNKGAGTLVN